MERQGKGKAKWLQPRAGVELDLDRLMVADRLAHVLSIEVG
jgi:hypothetical protein